MSNDLVKRLRRADTCIFPIERDRCHCGEAADRIAKLEAALSLAGNWMSNRAVHFGELCTSKQCVCGKALVLFNVIQALEGEDE
jgi:hypothetical protein